MKLATPYKGFWWPDLTGEPGRSFIKNHTKKQIECLTKVEDFPWLRELLPDELSNVGLYLVRHVPTSDPYSEKTIQRLLDQFDLYISGPYNKVYIESIDEYKIHIKKATSDVNDICVYNKYSEIYIGGINKSFKLLNMGIHSPTVADWVTSTAPLSNASVANLGYSTKDGKWYGWDHQKMHGFGIGSKIEIGSEGYKADTPENFKSLVEYQYKDIETDDIFEDFDNGFRGIVVRYKSGDQIKEDFHPYPEVWGRGEWTSINDYDSFRMAAAYVSDIVQ